jgi:hypothetical protein
MQGGIAMDHTGIYNAIRDKYKISDELNNSESTTMIRLNELHVKVGSARQQQYDQVE